MLQPVDIDSYRQLTNGSLPDMAEHLCDDELIKQAITRVVTCYSPAAACLVLEAVSELRIKASYGMSTGTLPLSSITRHVSGRPLPIIIYDAQADERFVSDSLVAGPPFVRFYIGAPIIIHGDLCVGSLCLFETRPRDEFALDQCDVLEEAARTIAEHVEGLGIDPHRVPTMTTLQQLPPMSCVNTPEDD